MNTFEVVKDGGTQVPEAHAGKTGQEESGSEDPGSLKVLIHRLATKTLISVVGQFVHGLLQGRDLLLSG